MSMIVVESKFEFDFEFFRGGGDFGFIFVVVVRFGFHNSSRYVFALYFFSRFFASAFLTFTITVFTYPFTFFRRFIMFGDRRGWEIRLRNGTFFDSGETHVGTLEITNRRKMFPIVIPKKL